LAGAKLPSMKDSRASRRPRIRRSSASSSRTPRIIPDRTHCWNRRWQVWQEGYRSGRSDQGAPVRSTHRMPFKTDRRGFHGRPRPSLRTVGSGMRTPRISHCLSVRSRLRFRLIGLRTRCFAPFNPSGLEFVLRASKKLSRFVCRLPLHAIP